MRVRLALCGWRVPGYTDPIPLTFNFNDGDVAPPSALDGSVNSADYLLVLRAVLKLIPVDNQMLAHADLYPAGAPDGIIDLRDLLLELKLLLP